MASGLKVIAALGAIAAGAAAIFAFNQMHMLVLLFSFYFSY